MRGAVLAAFPLGHQHVERPANLFLVLFPGDVVLQRSEPLVPLLNDSLRHLTVHVGGGGAGALGVLERERASKPSLTYDVQGLLEVLVGLAREAHDDVGSDRRVGHRGADPLDNAQVTLLAVRPLHRAEHGVGTALQWHVQLVHDVRRLGHRLDDVIGERSRMRRGEAHSL